MWHLKQTTVTVLLAAIALGLNTELPAQSKSDPYCRQVNYPIGLNVRSAPSSSSRRVGVLAYGQKIKLAGQLQKVGSEVTLIMNTAQDSSGTTWVKIKAPLRGFVLFATGADRNSLISCDKSLS